MKPAPPVTRVTAREPGKPNSWWPAKKVLRGLGRGNDRTTWGEECGRCNALSFSALNLHVTRRAPG